MYDIQYRSSPLIICTTGMTNKKSKRGGKEAKLTAKSKQRGVKATNAEPADDFDDMLAKFAASDLLPSGQSATTFSSSASTSSPHMKTSTPSHKPTTDPQTEATKPKVSEDTIDDACRRGDITQLRRWRQQGIHFEARALHFSAFHGMLEIVRCLIKELGVDVNIKDRGKRRAERPSGHCAVPRQRARC
jgi:hypothetical protein